MSSGLSCTKCGTVIKQGSKFCSACGSSIGEISITPPPKVSQTIRHPMSRTAKLVYSILAIGLAGIFLFVFMSHLPGREHPVIALQPEVALPFTISYDHLEPQPIDASVQNGTISFSLATLREKKMVEFEYRTSTGTVPLLAFISTDGKLITAIRMCEPCNSSKFSIEGVELACGNCETRWKLSNFEGIQGSCQQYPPDPVASEVIGDRVVIQENVVKNWKMRI